MNKDVEAVLVRENINENQSKSLLSKFQPYHAQINEALEESRNIIDPEKPTAQKLARTCRLELRRVRCEIENVRKEVKADALRYGKAVDGLANVLKFLCEPEEKRLEQIEKYAEIKERERIAALVAERTAKLIAVEADPSAYNLETMDESTFDSVLSMAEKIKCDRIEAERKAEAERIAKEKAEAEEREKMRKENERLKAEAEARKKALAKERAEREKAEAAAKAKAEKERKRIEIERAKERAELESKARAEAEAREKLERAAAEEKRKADQAKRKAEKQAKEQAKKEADKKHRNSVMNAAYHDLVNAGIETEQAIATVNLIANGKVSNVSINW